VGDAGSLANQDCSLSQYFSYTVGVVPDSSHEHREVVATRVVGSGRRREVIERGRFLRGIERDSIEVGYGDNPPVLMISIRVGSLPQAIKLQARARPRETTGARYVMQPDHHLACSS
jgi:hypothetical protein